MAYARWCYVSPRLGHWARWIIYLWYLQNIIIFPRLDTRSLHSDGLTRLRRKLPPLFQHSRTAEDLGRRIKDARKIINFIRLLSDHLLAHRCLHGSAPPYLIRYFTPISSIVGRSHLCSAVTGTLLVPRSRTSTIGPRAFAISSPSAWNSLPADLRDPGLSLLTFRLRLKTYLFNPPGYLSS